MSYEETCGFYQRLATCFPSCYSIVTGTNQTPEVYTHTCVAYAKCWDDDFTQMLNYLKESEVQCALLQCGFQGFAPPTIHAVSTHLLCLLAVFLSIF